MSGAGTRIPGDRPAVRLESIRKTYGEGDMAVHAIAHVDLTVPRGQYLAIMGASGSGKSTLMNIVGCLDAPSAGRYFIDGVDVRRLDENQLSVIRNNKIGESRRSQSYNMTRGTSAQPVGCSLPLIYAGVSVQANLLSADEIRRLLGMLDEELSRAGIVGEMFLVGGAAMAIAYDRNRATRDLDAVFEPKAMVYEAAARVAAREGLPADWLNDAVKGFLPGPDPAATVALELPSLRVRIASPGYLFALKAAAARGERDADDLRLLFRLCGFADVECALDHVEHTLGRSFKLAPKTAFLLRELLDDPSG